MILKLRVDRHGEWGWMYLDGVVCVNVDHGYGIHAREDKDHTYAVVQRDNEGNPTETAFNHYRRLMTDLPSRMKPGEFKPVIVIIAELRDGDDRSFVCDTEMNGYLLSDETGKTIERI